MRLGDVQTVHLKGEDDKAMQQVVQGIFYVQSQSEHGSK